MSVLFQAEIRSRPVRLEISGILHVFESLHIIQEPRKETSVRTRYLKAVYRDMSTEFGRAFGNKVI